MWKNFPHFPSIFQLSDNLFILQKKLVKDESFTEFYAKNYSLTVKKIAKSLRKNF